MDNDHTVCSYDRLRADLNATYAKPTTFKHVERDYQAAETYTVEVGRTDHGDYCFIELVDKSKTVTRMALPPKVLNAIARQRESLSKRLRSSRAKERMAERMASGFVPTFKKR